MVMLETIVKLIYAQVWNAVKILQADVSLPKDVEKGFPFLSPNRAFYLTNAHSPKHLKLIYAQVIPVLLTQHAPQLMTSEFLLIRLCAWEMGVVAILAQSGIRCEMGGKQNVSNVKLDKAEQPMKSNGHL